MSNADGSMPGEGIVEISCAAPDFQQLDPYGLYGLEFDLDSVPLQEIGPAHGTPDQNSHENAGMMITQPHFHAVQRDVLSSGFFESCTPHINDFNCKPEEVQINSRN